MPRVVLGADDDEDTVTTTAALSLPHVLPPNQIQPNPDNLRPTDVEVDEMAADLKDNGQLHNINVMTRQEFAKQQPHLADLLGPEPFVAINGNCRLAAARKVGLALKYEVRDEWTRLQIDSAMIRENVHRKDVNPMLLGRKLLAMLPDYEGSERKLARALNVSPAWVNHRIGLTKLHPDLQAAVEAERITWTLARECPRLHRDLQPLLASRDLPADIAMLWLGKLRLKANEQLARWEAGPPYDQPQQRATPPEAPKVNTADSPSVEKSEPKPATEPVVPSSPSPTPPTEGQEPKPQAAERQPASPPRQAAQSDPQVVLLEFRLPDTKPATLARALREKLPDQEFTDLVEELTALV